MLLDCNALEDSVELRAVAYHLSCSVETSGGGDVMPIDGQPSMARIQLACQAFESCGLSST